MGALKKLNRVRRRHCYTMKELAVVLAVHVRTVQSWHKQGMNPIEPDDRPLLFLGDAVRAFLIQKRDARKRKLGPREFLCVRCQAARLPAPDSVSFEPTGRRMGIDDEQVIIRAKCIECGCGLTCFATRKSILRGFWRMIFQKAENR